MLKIYSTTNCSICKVAKNYMDEQNIDYQEINVESDEEAMNYMLASSGSMSVPVFENDDTGEWMVGFNKNGLTSLIEEDFLFDSKGSDEYQICEACE